MMFNFSSPEASSLLLSVDKLFLTKDLYFLLAFLLYFCDKFLPYSDPHQANQALRAGRREEEEGPDDPVLKTGLHRPWNRFPTLFCCVVDWWIGYILLFSLSAPDPNRVGFLFQSLQWPSPRTTPTTTRTGRPTGETILTFLLPLSLRRGSSSKFLSYYFLIKHLHHFSKIKSRQD